MDSKIKIFTIGFTKKSAQEFFELLKRNNIRRIIDIRLNNVSQLAGYTKKGDLRYFLDKIGRIKYSHNTDLAPSEETFKMYRNKEISFEELKKKFLKILRERKPEKAISKEELDSACLLCSESNAKDCHRSIVAEYFQEIYGNIEVIHI